ncbi:MAG: DUF3667 domain-containing protein [Bacteroidota bacterium]
MNCKNCNTEIKQNYCPNCGQATKIKRIDGKYIAYEIGEVFNFERGILFTIKELLIRPGENIRNFISENRRRLVKPIIFIIVTSLIYSLINHFFHIEDGYVKYEETKQSTTGYIFQWVQDHYGYANIIMGIFIAFWTKLFFRKYDYNFFEILILLCFVMGIGMLIYSVFALFQVLTHIDLMQVAGIIGFLYSAWAIGQFFDKSKFLNYVKALFSYLLGFLTFSLTAILIGTLIDLIIKQ